MQTVSSSLRCNNQNFDTNCSVCVAKPVRPVHQAGQNQRWRHLQVPSDPSLRGRRWGKWGAGRACVWGWRVSLSWVMAESSRWCSLEQIGFPHVVTKGGYRVMNKVCKLKPQWSDWIEYIKTGERISSQMSVFGENRKTLASCVDVFNMKVCAGEVVDSKALGQTAFWDEQSKPWKKARNP